MLKSTQEDSVRTFLVLAVEDLLPKLFAWAYRDAKYSGVLVGVDPDAVNKEKISNWCKDYWETIHPYSAGGAYTNCMMDEGQDRLKANYKIKNPVFFGCLLRKRASIDYSFFSLGRHNYYSC